MIRNCKKDKKFIPKSHSSSSSFCQCVNKNIIPLQIIEFDDASFQIESNIDLCIDIALDELFAIIWITEYY